MIAPKNKVLLCVLDGVGYNPASEQNILSAVWAALPVEVQEHLRARASALAKVHNLQTSPEALARASLSPILSSVVSPALTAGEAQQTKRALQALRDSLRPVKMKHQGALTVIKQATRKLAKEQRYIPWMIETNFLGEMRDRGLSIPTEASGMAVGFEDMDPPAQGNSETGHQQIGNLALAPQVALQITGAIDDGSFFKNKSLLDTLAIAQRSPIAKVGFCFLLSGRHGDDGRVHSAWNHLEAFLELVFGRMQFSPDRVVMEAILDGRDSAPRSSIELASGRGQFLQQLQALLKKYHAEQSLAWVIGRSIGMDRDYVEENTATDYLLMTRAEGAKVEGIDGVLQHIRQLHAQGLVDSNIPPICVAHGGNARTLSAGDVFIDLNFRADRQRGKVAALLGARDFLKKESQSKKRTWTFDWLSNTRFPVCCLAEYHPAFAEKYGATVAFPELPHPHNFLTILGELGKKKEINFHYLLTAESNKALHMGYFIRGRREEPTDLAQETRRIIPSYGPEAGVMSDNDFYKTPHMKNFELVGILSNEAYRASFDLMAANFSNCDMVGHLLPDKFDAAVAAYSALDKSLGTLVPLALAQGYFVVITSDHGNIEDDGATHTANPILTTFLSPEADLECREDIQWNAHLFDICWGISQIMGIDDLVQRAMPKVPDWIVKKGLVGKPLLKPISSPKGRRRE
ncbi:MAG: hypothetical protein EXR67_04925 [Dehalococcoidia bacterium]|nr:hypothetical protein [Dehalococcoidia bacterium]